MAISPVDLPTSIFITVTGQQRREVLLSGCNDVIAVYGSYSTGITVEVPLCDGVYDKPTSQGAPLTDEQSHRLASDLEALNEKETNDCRRSNR